MIPVPIPALSPKNIALGLLILVFAIMAWQLRSCLKRSGELEVQLEVQVSETQEAADANVSNLMAIDALRARIASMVQQRAAEAAERERILNERDEELARARARADQLERERQNERFDNQDCADLSSLSIELFCPAAAEQLRVRSRGPGGNGDTDSR